MQASTLLIPALYWPEALAASATLAPNLKRLLHGMTATEVPPEPVWSRLLWQHLGGRGDLPLAEALAHKHKVDDAHVLRADPVHLQVGRDDVSLANPFATPLTESEADALIKSLNAHLSEEGMRLTRLTPRQWLLSLPRAIAMNTQDPWAAVGQAQGSTRLAAFTASTPLDERLLKRVLTELQMLLYGHPVNSARQSQGLPVINSLWFWAAGQRGDVALHTHFVSDCINANTVVAQLPVSSKHGLLHYHTALVRPYFAGDLAAWQSALSSIDAQLADVKSANLIMGDGRAMRTYHCATKPWWRNLMSGHKTLSQLLTQDG